MAMTPHLILADPAIAGFIRIQAQSLISLHEAGTRIASPFATQQRWLMSQAGLGQYFRNAASKPGAGLLPEHFIKLALRHDLASRNTAGSFLQEMLKYGVVRCVAGSADKRIRPFEPSPATLTMLTHWLAIHLTTLDSLDGGPRLATLRAQPSLLGVIQPLIADSLLASSSVRKPDRTFSLFTWVNDGGVVMDRLIAGCQTNAASLTLIPTDIRSISALSRRLSLSRTQLSRKFGAAEAMGSLGWIGARGRSLLWVSEAFRHEYHMAQAVKLAIIDAAFEACFQPRRIPVAEDAISA